MNRKIGNWAAETGTGQVFDSQTFFRLNNGAKRMPEVAWVKNERWNALTIKQQEGIVPIAPDFVIELRSKTDVLKDLRDKMQEFIENGVLLGWLIDLTTRKVYVYRPNAKIEILESPTEVSGKPLLQGFTLYVEEIWA